jgi:hypothetical protein
METTPKEWEYYRNNTWGYRMMDSSDKIQFQALIVSTVMNLQLPQIAVISSLFEQLFALWTLLHKLICYYNNLRDMPQLWSKKNVRHTAVPLLQDFLGVGENGDLVRSHSQFQIFSAVHTNNNISLTNIRIYVGWQYYFSQESNNSYTAYQIGPSSTNLPLRNTHYSAL